jgi:hypothetical protein
MSDGTGDDKWAAALSPVQADNINGNRNSDRVDVKIH